MIGLRCSQRLLMLSRTTAVTPSLHPKELQTERYLSLRSQFSKLTVEELATRGLQLGKQVIQKDERIEAQALIMEVIAKVRHLPYRSMRDLLIMANTASLHSECVGLFHAKWELSLGSKDASFVPHEAVVDSAFALGDIDELARLATLAADRLERFSREIACDFVTWRIIWRLAGLCIQADDARDAKKRDMAEEAATQVWETCIKKYHPHLYNTVQEHILPYNDDGRDFTPVPPPTSASVAEATTTKTSSDPPGAPVSAEVNGGVTQKIPIITHPAHPPPLVYTRLDVEQGSTMRKGFQGIFRRIQRIVLYHRVPQGATGDAAATQQTPGLMDKPVEGGDGSTSTSVSSGGERMDALPDNGEMKFFLYCSQQNLLRFRPRKFLEPPLAEEPPINSGNVEQYYFSLVGSCRRGLYVEQAILYADEYRALLEERKRQDAMKTTEELAQKRASSGLVSSNEFEENNNLLPSTTASASQSANPSPATLATAPRDEEDTTVAESFIFHVLSVLQAARAHKQTLRFTRPILAETSQLTAALWSQILLAAGEERQVLVCRQGFDHAVQSLKSQSSLTAVAPSQMEYLLQTSLHALAKCHVPNFYDSVIAPCIEAKYIALNDETIAYLMTQNALHAPDAEGEVIRTREWMKERGQGMSTRVASLMMKVLMRVESPEMISFYKELVALARSSKLSGGSASDRTPSVVFKRIWLEELILCADRRRYALSQEDRRFIISEIERVFGELHIDPHTGKFSTSVLEGLRTQVAMIYYDAKHEPLAAFQRWEDQSERDCQHHTTAAATPTDGEGPSIPPPYLTDPRCYFLTRKPHCCTRTLETAAWRHHCKSFMDPHHTIGAADEETMSFASSKRARRDVAEACMSDMLHHNVARSDRPARPTSNSRQQAQHEDGYRALLATLLEETQKSGDAGELHFQ
ncbi:Hypothetical protein, putative [Bodo saltans]|uniref:Uncharacterized protein n=1 Tax=Bodo saltans TaxID=75058 RepID=A0A0S4JFJ1_BODSA|nr:Hypothetical protein, putative [Bodo saltans]|eukprot:CUG90362.1 Hypothetical protein, putative [Bodo saltans]